MSGFRAPSGSSSYLVAVERRNYPVKAAATNYPRLYDARDCSLEVVLFPVPGFCPSLIPTIWLQ